MLHTARMPAWHSPRTPHAETTQQHQGLQRPQHSRRAITPFYTHAPALQLVQEKSSGLSSVVPGMQAVHTLAPRARFVSLPAGQRVHVLAA